MDPAPAPTDDPHRLPQADLMAALRLALARDGALLTAGENTLLAHFFALPEQARALYARLLARQPGPFPLRDLHYPEIPEIGLASAQLVAAGLAWAAERLLPTAWLLQRQTAAEIRVALRALGLPSAGAKADLVARLAAAGGGAVRQQPWLLLRHRGLMRRLLRLALSDHHGDLSRLVVARLGLVRFPTYAPTGGAGLFPHRRALLAYEQGLARRDLDAEAQLAALPATLTRIAQTPPPDPLRRRFSGRRFDEALALGAASQLERARRPDAAAAVYAALIAADAADAALARLRLALCLEALGDPGAGARVCAEGLALPMEAVQTDPRLRPLERTGRRLARKARVPFAPLPPLRSPPERWISLPPAPGDGRRPHYRVDGADRPVEPAIMATLSACGRRALHVETSLWTTLFALLMRPALFAPVPGMLPTALLSGPLDLRTPGFFRRRQPLIQGLLGRIRGGAAPALLDAALDAHLGEAIVGARWDRVGPDALQAVVAALPGPALAAVLHAFCEDWRGAARGMPDLVLLPGPATKLAEARPGRLREGLLLIEVKGPGDPLSDAQRVWLHRLLQAEVPTELWRVRASG